MEESGGVSPPVQQGRTSVFYEKRCWGPAAVVALMMVVLLNGAVLRNNIVPAAASTSTHRRAWQGKVLASMADDRVLAAVEHHFGGDEESRLFQKIGRTGGGGVDMRHLGGEEEGGVMEYTRRRHRYLGEYIHQDKSGEFSQFGKISTSLIYLVFWVSLMFPDTLLPIGRPGIALGGGLVMIVWRYFLVQFGSGPSFDAERDIFMEPLFLLFGLMLTTIYLEKMERGGLFDKLRESMDDPVNWKRSAKIMLVSAVGSAAVMNDSVALVFSGVVVDLCARHKVVDSFPYLLSLATAANIGSALTMTGNPQNILIVTLSYDDIGWIEFFRNMILPVLTASVINGMILFAYYSTELFPGASGFGQIFGIIFAGKRTPEMLAQEDVYSEYLTRRSEQVDGDGVITLGWSIWSKIQLLTTIMFLFFFALGFNACAVSIVAGLILMAISAFKRKFCDPLPAAAAARADDDANRLGDQPEPKQEGKLVTESATTLAEVDYGLLLLFMGQFLLVGSFDDTGVPQAFYNWTMGSCADRMAEGMCVYRFVTIVAVLSNVASNVPVCQMLAAAFPFANPYQWLQVSYAASIAGNMTMFGSTSNMIVAFQAAKVGNHTFTTTRHALFNFPSSLACLYVGTAILAAFHFAPECSVKLGECEGMEAYIAENRPSVIALLVAFTLCIVCTGCVVFTVCLPCRGRALRREEDASRCRRTEMIDLGAGDNAGVDDGSDLHLFEDYTPHQRSLSLVTDKAEAHGYHRIGDDDDV